MSGTSPAAKVDRLDLLRELEAEVAVMVRRIRRVIAERARAVHPELQSATYLMLGWIEQHGPVRASSIAESFAIDKGAISRQAQHLIDLGLVDRSADPEDGRATLLSVSAAAKRRLEAVVEERRAWVDGRLGDLSDRDLAELVRLLGRYNAALDD